MDSASMIGTGSIDARLGPLAPLAASIRLVDTYGEHELLDMIDTGRPQL
jgi:hypothetical protein